MASSDLYLSEADCPMVLQAVHANRLQVVSGTVWITASGLPEDVFLQAGAFYVIPRNGKILIEAIHGAARLQVQPRVGFSGLWARLRRKLDADASGLGSAV